MSLNEDRIVRAVLASGEHGPIVSNKAQQLVQHLAELRSDKFEGANAAAEILDVFVVTVSEAAPEGLEVARTWTTRSTPPKAALSTTKSAA